VLVVTKADSNDVVAYHTWCMASIVVTDAPGRPRQGSGRYPQPVALLARLGVDVAHEARGLGAGLLGDVIARTAELGTDIGCRGLLIHAELSAGRDFYVHLIPELIPSPTEELHLVLLMKDIRRTLRESRHGSRPHPFPRQPVTSTSRAVPTTPVSRGRVPTRCHGKSRQSPRLAIKGTTWIDVCSQSG
jgi:hypothetical protein